MCAYLTTPGSLISALRYSGGPTGGPTSKVNSGLEKMRGEFRDKIDEYIFHSLVKANANATKVNLKQKRRKTFTFWLQRQHFL